MKSPATVAFVAAVMLLAGAMAGGLPREGSIDVVDDRGELIGSGSVHDGTLEVELGEGASGFVTLLVVAAGGASQRLQALVPLDGSLHVLTAGGVVSARAFAERHALAFTLHSQAGVEASSAPSGGAAGGPGESAGAIGD